MKLAMAGLVLFGLCLQDKIDNPEYGNWKDFKAGSSVTVKIESETAGNKSEMEQTHTLLEINADKAVVETTGKMKAGEMDIDMPASKRDIPAKVDKPKETGEKPKVETKEGDEEIEVAGKKIKCHWIETTVETGGNKTWSKIWYTKEIPGGWAKQESKTEGQFSTTSKMWVTAFEKK